MKHTLKVSSLALLDIEEAIHWYGNQKAGLEKELEESLFQSLDYLVDHPFHNEQRYKNVRVKFIRRFPFGIHYLIDDKQIKVLGFFHMKRDPRKWHKRLKQDE